MPVDSKNSDPGENVALVPNDSDSGENTAPSDQALAPYKPPFLDREIISAANIGAKTMRAILFSCMKIADLVRSRTGAVIDRGREWEHSLELEEELSIPLRIRRYFNIKIGRTMMAARNLGRNMRLFDKVNTQTSPRLLDDDYEDRSLKRDIVADLNRRIALRAPLFEVIETIGRTCFDLGIPAEKLISFLESDDVMDLLIDKVLTRKHSRWNGDNAKSIIATSLETGIYKCEAVKTSREKRPVDEETGDEIRRKIVYFQDHYNPQRKENTVVKFLKELESKYAEYDVLGWLKKNKHLLVTLVRGGRNTQSRHVANMVNEIYIARARLNPAQFIELNLYQFFSAYEIEGIHEAPAFVRAMSGVNLDDHSSGTICHFDLERLAGFFARQLKKISGPEMNLLQLRRELIEGCIRKIDSIRPSPAAIIFLDQPGKAQSFSFERATVITELTARITDACQVVSSHVDIRNLLYDPMGVPPEMQQNYRDWYDGEGKLNVTDYRHFLRGIFGHKKLKDGTTKDEHFDKLKRRATEMFQGVNEYLASVTTDLGLPPITVPSVQQVNDYAELIKIVCTTEDPRERFAARRKIELAALMYTCTIAPRYAYQDLEARATKADLEHSRRGIDYQSDVNDKVYFIDDPNFGPREISADRRSDLSPDTPIKEIELIPVKFGGEIKCHLMPTSADDPFEYMGKKTLFNMLTNLLNEDNKRAKDMTDILRMTFVADSEAQLTALQRYIETHYISFGRSVKHENRYKDDGNDVNVAENQAKADDYRAIRYVVDITVEDDKNGKDYAVPIEIRILLTEDLIREKSAHHPAGHRKYEERRLKQVVENKLAPKEIFPEIYKQEGPDPDDIFQTVRTVVKDSSDFAVLANP